MGEIERGREDGKVGRGLKLCPVGCLSVSLSVMPANLGDGVKYLTGGRAEEGGRDLTRMAERASRKD